MSRKRRTLIGTSAVSPSTESTSERPSEDGDAAFGAAKPAAPPDDAPTAPTEEIATERPAAPPPQVAPAVPTAATAAPSGTPAPPQRMELFTPGPAPHVSEDWFLATGAPPPDRSEESISPPPRAVAGRSGYGAAMVLTVGIVIAGLLLVLAIALFS